MSEYKKIFKKNLTKEHEKIIDALSIDESVRYVENINKDYIIITELKIMRVNKDLNIVWKHDYHSDVIMEAKIIDNLIKVIEFNNSKYVLDINSGKLV